MTITHETLAHRLRQAREAVGLSQAQVAKDLGLSRPTISQIEAGDRKVTSVELAKLARLYGCAFSDFLDEEFDPDTVLRTLFRACLDQELQPVMLEAARHCLEIGRETNNLEQILEIPRPASRRLPMRSAPPPVSLGDAHQQAEDVAVEERSRLGLGLAPLPDLVDLFESQGIRVGLIALPDEVEGLTLFPPDLGPYVVVNAVGRGHARRRFSFAHEFAHVLFDAQEQSHVSLKGEEADAREQRANAFAAAFLMPAEGVRRFLVSVGKRQWPASSSVAEESRNQQGDPRSWSAVQPADVVQLAHHFGVSHEVVIRRLDTLGDLAAETRETLRQARTDDSLYQLHGLMFGRATDAGADEPESFRHRFLGLVLEALRRDEISWGKGRELGRLIGLEDEDFETLCDHAGLERDVIDFILPHDMV